MSHSAAAPPRLEPLAMAEPRAPWRTRHPIAALTVSRTGYGLITLLVVSILIFLATEVLPGNAAYAVLGHSATPQSLHILEHRLGLDRSIPEQYWKWISGVLHGHFGTSLASGDSVWSQTGPRLLNSAVLVFAAGLIGAVLGIAIGALAALRRDSWSDHLSAVLSLCAIAMPEFVIAIALILLFATSVFHILPAVSVLPPGTHPWSKPKMLVLPVLTLLIVIVPYIQRMMRATMIEALESDYVEMARLKGLSSRRVVFMHAFPNALPPTVQVIGLNFLYLAGGIVVVENVFNYPGVGQLLVNSVTDRDIPVIQFVVLVLAAFYVMMNIATDVIVLLATPRRRRVR